MKRGPVPIQTRGIATMSGDGKPEPWSWELIVNQKYLDAIIAAAMASAKDGAGSRRLGSGAFEIVVTKMVRR